MGVKLCLLSIFLLGYQFLTTEKKKQVSYNCKLLVKKQLYRAFFVVYSYVRINLVAQLLKNLLAMRKTWV